MRDKPVSETDVRIFGKKCIDMRVREAAVLMASDAQEDLDIEDLAKWAEGFGLGLTTFHGWPGFVDQVLFWSELPKPVAASQAVKSIHSRLIEIEASPKSVERWISLTKRAS